MNNFFYNLSIQHSRLSAFFAREKHCYDERFAYPHEVAHLSFEKPHDYGLLLGVDQFGRILQITPTKKHANLGNVLKVAPSQRGKSTDFKRQLCHWKGSAIVNNIKGELSRDTAKIRAKFSDIIFFDATETAHTYDPLSGKETEDDLYAVAKMLLYEPNEKDPAFTQRGTKMLTLLFMAAKQSGESPFPFVRELSHCGVNSIAKRIHAINPSLAQRLVDGDYNPDKDYRESKYLVDSWESLTARLYPFLTETVVKSLSSSDFRIADLLTAKRPVTIYLNWPESKLRALQPLISLFWGLFTGELKDTYDAITKDAPDAPLQKILFLIDEGGVTPIPELQDHMATCNGRGMSFVMGIQALSQLVGLYGEANAETILNNCSKVFFQQESLSTAKHVTELLGPKSAFASSHTSHGDQTTEGKQEREVPLLSPQAIRGMSEENVLIFHREVRYAIQAKRIPFSKQETPLALPSPSLRLSSGAMPPPQYWRHNSGLRFTAPPVSSATSLS